MTDGLKVVQFGRIAILGGAGVDGGQLTTYLDGPYNDDLVTWVVYAKADNAGDKLHTELWGGGGVTDQPLTAEWQAYKFSGHRNINHHDFYLWGCVGNKGNIYVALPFAVVGNTIGTWGPNPNDMATRKDFVALDVTLKGLQSTVSSNYGELQSQLNQTASTLRGELVDKANGIQNQITATANSELVT